MPKFLRVTMPNQTQYDVPIDAIALNHATHYADEYDGDVNKSLQEGTLPLFEDESEIYDWAGNQMYWSMVESQAKRVFETPRPLTSRECEEGWSGEARIVEYEPDQPAINKILAGLKILEQYYPNDDFAATHDLIWYAPYEPDKLSAADLKTLDDLGWFEDEECWAHHC